MIQMIVKICVDCNQPIDQCRFQKGLRQFGWDKFADSISKELEVGECTNTS